MELVSRGRIALRRDPLPLRLPALSAAAAACPARPSRRCTAGCTPPDLEPLFDAYPRGAARLDLRRPAPADPAGQLAGDRLPRPAAEPAHVSRASRATTWRSSAASRPRSDWTGPSRSPALAGMTLQGRRQDLPGGARLLRADDRAAAPRRRPWVEFVGEVGGRRRTNSSATPSALLFPIDWPEPFGLVMIEAMACGTPGHRLAPRLGPRGDDGRRDRLRRGRRPWCG